jgi:serine/threonine protein phosphatase PrpC
VQALQQWLGPLWNDDQRSTYVIDRAAKLILASHGEPAPGTSLSEYEPAQKALHGSGAMEYKAPESDVSQLVSYSQAIVPGWAVLVSRASSPDGRFGDSLANLVYLVLIVALIAVAAVMLLSAMFQPGRSEPSESAPLQPAKAPGRDFSRVPSIHGGKSEGSPVLEPSGSRSSYGRGDWAKPLEGQEKKRPETLQKMEKPDSQTSPSIAVQQGLWKCAALSVKGTSHQKTGMPCQDASYCRIVRGKILVGAVADGAGSASHSELGSNVAVRKAVETVAEHVENCLLADDDAQWKRLLLSAMDVARGNVEASAAGQNKPTRQLATTLILFVATSDLVAAAQIGDGAVVLQDAHGEIRGLTSPQSGEYINTTTFLVSADAFRSVQQSIWRGSCANIAAFTDGLQMLALNMPGGNPHPQFFTPLFGFLENHSAEETLSELGKFLRSDKITNRADDDLTLMLAANSQ